MTGDTVLITRPLPDANRTAAAVEAAGFEPIVVPLMRVAGRPEGLRGASQADALAVTSANGVRAYAAAQGAPLPVYAVGPASAEAAREAGLEVAGVAGGDVASLAALVAKVSPGRVLHPGGARLAGDLGGALRAAGVPYERAVLYEIVEASALPEPAREALGAGLSWVMAFSPRSGALLARLVRKAGLADAVRGTRCAALSAPVAEAVSSLPFADVIVPEAPEHSDFVDILSARRT